MKIRLGVAQRRNDARSAPCATRRSALELHPAKGTTFQLTTPIRVEMIDDAGRPMKKAVTFHPVDGNELTIELPDLALRIDALPGQTGFGLCEG